jgi:hypothetical protein
MKRKLLNIKSNFKVLIALYTSYAFQNQLNIYMNVLLKLKNDV